MRLAERVTRPRDRRSRGALLIAFAVPMDMPKTFQWIPRSVRLSSHSRYILALLGVSAFAPGSKKPRQVLNASLTAFALRLALVKPTGLQRSQYQRCPLSAAQQPSLSWLSCRTAWCRALSCSCPRCSWCSRSLP